MWCLHYLWYANAGDLMVRWRAAATGPATHAHSPCWLCRNDSRRLGLRLRRCMVLDVFVAFLFGAFDAVVESP